MFIDDDVDFLYNTISKCDGYVVYRNPSPQLIQRHYSHNNRIPPILVSTKHSENSAKVIITNRNQSWTTSKWNVSRGGDKTVMFCSKCTRTVVFPYSEVCK